MKKITRIILITGIMIMNAACADTNYKQPLYSLEFDIYGTGAEIYLNGISAYYHDTQGQTLSEKPIPEYIIDGNNTLTIKSFPLEEDNNKYQKDAHIEITISVREKDALSNKSLPVVQLKLNPTNTENKLLDGTLAETGTAPAIIISHSENETIAERHVTIKSPFPHWAWQDGQTIEDTPENFSSLLEKYKEIWEALNTEDMEKTTELYNPAAQEFAAAYHYKNIQEGHRIINTGGLIGDADWKLGSMEKFLEKFNYRMDITANGKMAKILDQKNRSPIVYLSKKAKIINIQKFSFYKNKNNEWIMIR